jgi:hypothetical protein
MATLPEELSFDMKMSAKLAKLRSLQSRADTLRRELGISRPGKATFLATRNGVWDDIVVVEADGLGGATTSIVVGNYPVDYLTVPGPPRKLRDAAESLRSGTTRGRRFPDLRHTSPSTSI